MWLFTLTVINITSAYAATVDITAPNEVAVGEEFTIHVTYLEDTVYDVKAFVQSTSDNKTLSEIFSSGKWTSPFKYLIGVYPETKTFSIRVKNFSSASDLCVRMRKSGTSAFKEGCRTLAIRGEKNQDETQSSNSNSSEDIESEDRDESEKRSSKSATQTTGYVPLATPPIEEKPAKIVLQPLNPSSETLITKEEKIRQTVIYSFAAFCILLIILLSFNKL